MPYDPSVETKVALDNGQVLTFPAGMPLAQIQDAVRRANTLPPGLPGMKAVDPTDPKASTPAFDIAESDRLGKASYPPTEDPTAGGLGGAALTGLSTGLSMVPGPGLGVTLTRMLAAPAAHALGSKDPLTDFNTQALLSSATEGASRLIPYITTPAALASGGFVSRAKGSFGKTVRAFNTEAERRVVPVLPGRGEKGVLSRVLPDTKTAMGSAGQRLQAAEEASPHTLNVRDLEIGDQRHASRLPISEREARNTFNTDTVSEQTMEHTLSQLMPNASPEELRDFWAHGPKMPPGLAPAGLAQAFRDYLINRTNLPTRAVGELQRSMSRTAKPAIQAGRMGQASYMAPEAAERSNDLIKSLREWRHGPADQGLERSMTQRFRGAPPEAGQTGAINDADAQMSRLKTMDEANQAMRAGSFITDPGALATRSSLGAGAARIVGMDPYVGAGIGLAALNPEMISALGFLLSKGTRYAPAAYRGMETADQLLNPPSKKPVKRRTP